MTLLAPLIVLVVVAFIGYVTAYHVAFNTYLVQVSSFWSTSLFLGRAFLRDLDLMPLFRVSPFFASFMILTFYVTILLVGFNVLFAIIADAMRRERLAQKERDEEARAGNVDPISDETDDPIGEVGRSLKACGHRCTQKFPILQKCMRRRAQHSEAEAHRSSPDGGGGDFDEHPSRRASAMTVATLPSSSPLRALAAASAPSTSQAVPEMGKSIERMSGRLLGKIQRIGIEMCTEVADVTEKSRSCRPPSRSSAHG